MTCYLLFNRQITYMVFQFNYLRVDPISLYLFLITLRENLFFFFPESEFFHCDFVLNVYY